MPTLFSIICLYPDYVQTLVLGINSETLPLHVKVRLRKHGADRVNDRTIAVCLNLLLQYQLPLRSLLST